jgi:hypothetical protein
LNFNKVTRKAIPNSDLIRNQGALLAVAEHAFRKYHGVEGEKNLKDDGRFFLNEKEGFFLPAAMGFEQDHFLLFYNSYEIGPYVLGPTEIKIPLNDIKDMLNFTGTIQ